MNDASTAQPPDAATWAEPRGPHIPDALGRVPPLAWIFIRVAVLFAAMAVFVTLNVDLNGRLFLASGLFAVGPASLLLAVAAGLPSPGPTIEAGED